MSNEFVLYNGLLRGCGLVLVWFVNEDNRVRLNGLKMLLRVLCFQTLILFLKLF